VRAWKATIVPRYGAPVEVVDVAEPDLRARDVMISVRAASLNPLDYKIRDGKVKLVIRLKAPVRLGCDVAGVVTKIGPEVTRFAIGDEVFARLEKDRMGGLAEFAAADEAVVAKKPTNISFEEAASIPLAGLTSLQALRESAGLTKGQRVLVHAGAGGVGSLAIQIAKQLGLWVATTTSTKNIELVKSLGADEVVDYTKDKLADRLKDLDAVFDPLGGPSELGSLALVKRGGTVVGVGGLPDAAFAKQRLPVVRRSRDLARDPQAPRCRRACRREVRLPVHAPRWRGARRARRVARVRRDEGDHPQDVPARRRSRGVRRARARAPRAERSS